MLMVRACGALDMTVLLALLMSSVLTSTSTGVMENDKCQDFLSASESRMCSRICSGEDLSDKCSVCSVSSRESLSQDCLNCGSNTGGGSVCKLTMNGQTYTTYTVFLANASVDCTCSPPCRTCSDNSVGCTMCSIECERCVSEVSASPVAQSILPVTGTGPPTAVSASSSAILLAPSTTTVHVSASSATPLPAVQSGSVSSLDFSKTSTISPTVTELPTDSYSLIKDPIFLPVVSAASAVLLLCLCVGTLVVLCCCYHNNRCWKRKKLVISTINVDAPDPDNIYDTEMNKIHGAFSNPVYQNSSAVQSPEHEHEHEHEQLSPAVPEEDNCEPYEVPQSASVGLEGRREEVLSGATNGNLEDDSLELEERKNPHISKWKAVFARMCIERKQLSLKDKIGQGEFGCVWKGQLADNNQSERVVAVKTLKGTPSSSEVEDFISESAIMLDFKHPNVMSLLGVCFDTEDNLPLIVLPLMANGDLKSYLAKRRRTDSISASLRMMPEGFTEKQMIGMCLDIAHGMNYLSKLKFVHRDLAARNCMLDERLRVKVADFGLSRDVYSSDYYRLTHHKARLPVKWMAPESLLAKKYDVQSDVWSFGVTCWEVFSLGCTPYPGVDNADVIQYITHGKRLDKPDLCSEWMYQVMLSCWNDYPSERPTFKALVGSLEPMMGDGPLKHEYAVLEEARGLSSVCSDSSSSSISSCANGKKNEERKGRSRSREATANASQALVADSVNDDEATNCRSFNSTAAQAIADNDEGANRSFNSTAAQAIADNDEGANGSFNSPAAQATQTAEGTLDSNTNFQVTMHD